MPLTRYALIVGSPERYVAERSDDISPHFTVDVQAGRYNWRAAINVKNRRWPSQVATARVANFHHNICARVLPLKDGLYPIRYYPKHRNPSRTLALDYVRDGLFDYQHLTPIPAHKPGPNNDIMDQLAQDVINTRQANGRMFVWGEPYNNRGRRGIHNIHQNQGNTNRYSSQNGVDQDGAVMFWDGLKMTAYFIAFQSQTFRTIDGTGSSCDANQTIFDLLNQQNRQSGLG